MKLIIVLLIILLVVFCLTKGSEGFSPYGPYIINEFKGGIGSAPAGVNALPGAPQEKQNAYSDHVNPVQPRNPQNVWPQYKRQP
jgi:hypothetical protein